MKIRKSKKRGRTNHGWLYSQHSFSFGHYSDPEWTGVSALRVINEDIIAPSKGFGLHSHQDVEILTYVLQGELLHKDSLGNVQRLRAGEVQRMTAGTGIEHSEFNASASDPLHFLQIWIQPNQLDLTPSYEDKMFTDAQKYHQWCLLAADDTQEGALKIHQDVALYSSKLTERNQLNYALKKGRKAYLHVVEGAVKLNKQILRTGDAALIEDGEAIQIDALHATELLLFDLPSA